MRTITKYIILFLSMILLIYIYLYVALWSGKLRWYFWLGGDLEDFVYLLLFTLVWGALIKAIWRLEVRLLFK